jgi:hypothetical protein
MENQSKSLWNQALFQPAKLKIIDFIGVHGHFTGQFSDHHAKTPMISRISKITNSISLNVCTGFTGLT